MSGCRGVLKDALARLVRVQEALEDGDREFAISVLDDLRADIWKVIEAIEREEGAR